MSKLWCIAIALGDPADGMVVVSMQVNAMQEMAVAQAVSDVYRQTGTKLPLMGVNARELTREYLETVLKAMDEAEVTRPAVVQLVPKIHGPEAGLAAGMPVDVDWSKANKASDEPARPTAFEQLAQGLQQQINREEQRRLERIAHGLPPDEPAA